jgi:hypothetical protein
MKRMYRILQAMSVAEINSQINDLGGYGWKLVNISTSESSTNTRLYIAAMEFSKECIDE